MKKAILFPTDFSPTAKNAFAYAVELAKKMNATIDLISVFHLPVADASSVQPNQIDRMLHEKKQQVANHMAEFIKGPNKEYVGKTRIDYGVFISAEITEAAMDGDYDLIVMGMQGEHNRIEKLMGSTTSHTMMHAPCPVLAIPEQADFQGIEEIAYATDFYPNDTKAIRTLMDLAENLKARVHFVHVSQDEVEAAPQLHLANSSTTFAGYNVVTDDSIENGLNEFIKEKEVDVLALFIPRRRLWERLFHSSFSKRMAMNTRIPLLTFHG